MMNYKNSLWFCSRVIQKTAKYEAKMFMCILDACGVFMSELKEVKGHYKQTKQIDNNYLQLAKMYAVLTSKKILATRKKKILLQLSQDF